MKILVTWSTGNLWQSVIKNLLWKIAWENIYGLIRDESKKEILVKQWVQYRVGNYYDISSLETAFSGIEVLYFISSSDIENRSQQHENVVNAAKKTWVKHIIYTSFDGVENSKSSLLTINESHKNTEEYIQNSGINYTLLRHGIYLESIPDMIWPALETWAIFYPTGNVKVAFTSREDLAQATANLITTLSLTQNNIYRFVASNAYTFTEISEVLSKITGKNIEYRDITVEEYVENAKKVWIPEIFIMMWVAFWAAIANWEFALVWSDLEKVLWNQTMTLEKYLNEIYK